MKKVYSFIEINKFVVIPNLLGENFKYPHKKRNGSLSHWSLINVKAERLVLIKGLM